MSLSDAPFGYKAIRTLNGGEARLGEYLVSSLSARIFTGDLVDLLNSAGTITRRTTSSTENVLGASAEEFNQSGTASVKIKVFDDPSTVYEVQANNTAAITQAKFGNSYRIIATTGNTSLGASKEEVDIGTSAASASHIVRAIRLSPKLDNDLSLNSIVEVVVAGDSTKTPRA